MTMIIIAVIISLLALIAFPGLKKVLGVLIIVILALWAIGVEYRSDEARQQHDAVEQVQQAPAQQAVLPPQRPW
jgi:Na+-transporting methylmalonyl-CoA/oxaloacetate decarboxylase gamma subunit